MKNKVRLWKFYFSDGKIGYMRTWAEWNKKEVDDYNKRAGRKIINKVVEVKNKSEINSFLKREGLSSMEDTD